jgi:AhpD family alkylhydroperoxidase
MNAMKLTEIDPALAAFPRFGRASNGSTVQVDEMRRRHIYDDGVLSAKTKILMALLWSVNSRCEPCITYYARRAKELGASEAELGETLAVATTMGACVAETWAVKAFAAATTSTGAPDCAC